MHLLADAADVERLFLAIVNQMVEWGTDVSVDSPSKNRAGEFPAHTAQA